MSGTENEVDGIVRTGVISGHTFVNRVVQYDDVDGIALFEGDIELGTTAEVEQQTAACRGDILNQTGMQNVTTAPDLRWPGGMVHYEIADDLPNQQAVRDAIGYIHDETAIRFTSRTTEDDYVRFVYHPEINDSRIGRVGGEQLIRLTDGFDRGTVIHEIMHCLGAWHEHSRADRDQYVEIRWENIKPRNVKDFVQRINENKDVGTYDYGSIMHYPRDAFSLGGDTIVPLYSAGAQMGQRERLSPLDVAALRWMYPSLDWPAAPSGAGSTDYFRELLSSKAPVNDQFLNPNLAVKLALDKPFKILIGDDPYKRFPDDNPDFPRLEPDFLFPQRADIPFALATEEADSSNPQRPGHLTPTLAAQLAQVLGTLTWANAIRALSPADKECWAGTAAVYARLVAHLAERAR